MVPTWMKLVPQTWTGVTQPARWSEPATGKERVQSAAAWKEKVKRKSEKKVKRKSGRLIREQLLENQQASNWESLGWLEKTSLTRTASRKDIQTPLKKTD